MLRRSGMPGFGDGGGDSMELPGAGYGAKKGWSMTTLALGLFALLAVGALLLYGGGGGGSSLSPGEMAERRRSITESGRTLEAELEAELEAVRQSVQHEQHSVANAVHLCAGNCAMYSGNAINCLTSGPRACSSISTRSRPRPRSS